MPDAKQSHSVAGRAVLAVVFLIGFYVLALAIAGAFLFVPYYEWTYYGQVHVKLALICVLCGGAILWGILPRIDRFPAPGPKLTRHEHPKLFEQIEGVAHAVNQEVPAEVFLIHDVNASVGQRGGIMGFGSRRVMCLGLPLLRHLTIPELRAVLAHEFGHYHSGDTKAGPWIYKTRSVIVRTIESLGGEGGQSTPLQLPFIWYGKLFTRITHAISRRQEFIADELAARAVGSAPLISGLRKVQGVGLAFEGFWANEYIPVLDAGYMPSLLAGFDKFVQAKPVAEAVAKHLEEELQGRKANPYDSHPPLKERITAVQHLPAGESAADQTRAITLLADVTELEKLLLTTIIVPQPGVRFKPMDWSELGANVYLPFYKHLAGANTINLAETTFADLPELAARRETLCWMNSYGQEIIQSHRLMANSVVGAALVLALVARDWQLEIAPGAPVILRKGEDSLEPFNILDSLATQKLAAEDWQRQCLKFGLGDLQLACPENAPLAQAA